MLTVRPARPSEAPKLGEVYFHSWNLSAQGLLPPAVIAQRTLEWRVSWWKEQFRKPTEPTVLVAEDARNIVGVVRLVPAQERAVAELDSMYVDVNRMGHGVGSALMTAALQSLTDSGYERAFLWVFTGNQRAISFYRKHGWEPTEATDEVRIKQTAAVLPAVELERTLTTKPARHRSPALSDPGRRLI